MNNNETTVETTTSSLPIGNTVLGDSNLKPIQKPIITHGTACWCKRCGSHNLTTDVRCSTCAERL